MVVLEISNKKILSLSYRTTKGRCMSSNGTVQLEYASDNQEFPVAEPGDDKYLVYLGESFGNKVSKLASIGRLVTKPLPNGNIAFVLFQFHRPSMDAKKVLDAIGSPDVSTAPVIAYIKNRFYLMDKPVALEMCGSLDSAV